MDEHETEMLARSRLPVILEEALGVVPTSVRRQILDQVRGLVVVADGRAFLADAVARTDAVTLVNHWARVRQATSKASDVPIIVVPHMGKMATDVCDEHRINWVDLSGNASVRAQGLRLRILGKQNLYPRRGRPSSVFERRSSRIARALLIEPERDWSVRECAKSANLNEGYASRIIARLVSDELLIRDEHRRFRVRDAGLLLDSWRESVRFSKHRILRGHVPARSGEDLVRLLSARLGESQMEHAATGLGAAWLYDHFAMFRLATLYLREWPTPSQLDNLHFSEQPNGANVWLVLPNDEGVFQGVQTVEGIPCVHPVQVYVDLKDQPERSAEAAEHLRANPLLPKASRGG